jgi:hypothetical protein
MIYTPHTNIIWVTKIENNKMGGTCSRYGGEERFIQGFWWGNLVEKDNLEDLSVYGRILLK